MRLQARPLAGLAPLLAAWACIGESTPTVPEAPGVTNGTAEVAVATEGSNIDLDGYVVTLDESRSELVGPTGTVRFSLLPPGGYTVELSEVASNCTVRSGATRDFSVTAGNTSFISFTVDCV